MTCPLSRLAVVAALVVGLALAGGTGARADTILVFGQNGTSNTISATNNGAGTTTMSGSNIAVTITAIQAAVSTPLLAFLNFNATSTGAATTTTGGDVRQSFTGSFSIKNGATNYLSGNFTDAIFGSGSGLTMTASNTPPSTDLVDFSSNVITTLNPGRAISLSFTNVTPSVSIVNGSINSFTASIAGNFSANLNSGPSGTVPEPATLAGAVIGLGCLGLANLRRRRLAAVT